MPLKKNVSDRLQGQWQVGLFEAPAKAPGQCLYGCVCCCCASYQQREELLELTGEPYVCFGGLCAGCGPLGEPQDRSCLMFESCCCPGLAISGNRWIVQTRFDRRNTPCDEFIITFTICFSCVVEILQCFYDVPMELEMLADCMIMSVNGCMHAQQHIEIADVKKNGYAGPPQAIVVLLPPKQQEMLHSSGGVHAGHHFEGGPAPQTMGNSQPQPAQAAPIPQMNASLQVQCGNCRQIFGSPQSGITVACPFCGQHNLIG